MNLTSYKGITFTTLGVTSPKFAAPESPGPDRMPAVISRLDADPMVSGIEAGPQTMTFLFTPNGAANYTEPTLAKVLAAVNPDDSTPGLLVGQFLKTGPSTFVTVETEAVVGAWRYFGVNTLAIDFVVKSPWREQADTTLKSAGLISADGNFANLNTGFRDVHPKITVYWDGAQRASTVSTLGWKHRLGSGLTITNTGTEPLINQPYQIGPIDTKALVTAGRMQADGDDLRVFCEGRELSRHIIGPNTAGTFIWIILPTLAPLQAITLDILTNNPSAGSPPTFTFGEDLPAMDISGQSFTPTSSGPGDTVTLSGAGWETDQWKGGSMLHIASGSTRFDSIRRILSNTADTITFDMATRFGISTADTITLLKSGMKGTGYNVSSSTTSSITVSAADWMQPNEYVGATLYYERAGTEYFSTVTANTGNNITFSPSISPAPLSGTPWQIYQPNGNRMWDVRQPPKTTKYPGLWQANKIQAPPTQISFDAPGAWYRFTYQPNQDTYSQPRYDSFVVGTGFDHAPLMHIQRSRRGKVGAQREVGVADAVGVSSPFPINGIWFGYTLRNAKKAGSGTPGEGMCEARFMMQEAGGENWSTFLSDVAVRNTTEFVAAAWYDLEGSPNRVAMTLASNGDEIPANDNNTAELRTNPNSTYVALAVNPSAAITESVDWFTAPPAVVAVYDVDLQMRTGGASATPPYHRVEIGGSGHRVFIAATDERIVVDCARHTVSLTTDAGVFIRRIPFAIQANEIIEDTDGTNRTLVSARWLPIPPNTIDADAIYYSDPSGAGWGSLGLLVTGRQGYRV